MGIQDFPAALQPIIQLGYLEHGFEKSLQSVLGYREIADRETFPNKIGETITKTRRGLKAPTTTPLDPSGNTNLDNGLTPTGWTVEQYTLQIDMYGDTIDLNTVTQGVGIADQFVTNAEVNGVQAAQSLDRIARNKLYGAYLSGNTYVTTTLGAAGVTLAVDDIRGFREVLVNGKLVPVSSGSPVTVLVNGVASSCTGSTADGSNTSKSPQGISGTLTMAANVLVANGTLGNSVIAANAPTIIRPAGKTSSYTLAIADLFAMSPILDAVTQLRNNAVPPVTSSGQYHCYLDNTQLRELFKDSEFQLLYRGATGKDPVYKFGRPVDLLDLKFIPTTESPQQVHQTVAGAIIHRAICCGQGALIEGDYADMAKHNTETIGIVNEVDNICMVTRPPLDRLQQIIAQSWYWIGGYAVPTDATANSTIIPTASAAYFKRAVIVETL